MITQTELKDRLGKLVKATEAVVKDEKRVPRDAGIEIDTSPNLAGGPLSPAPSLIGPQGQNTP